MHECEGGAVAIRVAVQSTRHYPGHSAAAAGQFGQARPGVRADDGKDMDKNGLNKCLLILIPKINFFEQFGIYS